MKKGLTIIFLLIYSLSVFGIGLKEIYCCGKLKAVTIGVTLNERHKCNRSSDANGCCNTKYRYFKVKDNYLGTTSTTTPVKQAIEINTPTSLWLPCATSMQDRLVGTDYHSPPFRNGIPIHIYDCVYRI